MTDTINQRTEPVTPTGVNHLVLNVRDMEESHHFWSDLLGFKQVGKLKPREDGIPSMNMQFYSGVVDDVNHHDIALVERDGLPEPPDQWSMFEGSSAGEPHRHHLPRPGQLVGAGPVPQGAGGSDEPPGRPRHDPQRLRQRPERVRRRGAVRAPGQEVWDHDIDGALNYAVVLPEEQLLTDDTDYVTNFS